MSESGPVHVVRRMLWNHADGAPSRPQPLVVFLGPAGSGKRSTLESIGNDLRWGVVHARFDFDRGPKDPAPSTLEVLMRLVHGLSIKWRHRARPQFIRFAIALIAVQTPLDGADRATARKILSDKIKEFGRPTLRQFENLVNDLAASAQAAKLVQPAFVAVFKATFPLLIRNVRPRLRKALRSLGDFPQAVGASPLDALVSLNELAQDKRPRAQQKVTAWLFEAFLADVRENHKRMSVPDAKSPCACINPQRIRHRHNWVLLLDNIERNGGMAFLSDLTAARNEYLRNHGGEGHPHDALLVVATSGRWLGWNGWLPPWQPGPETQNGSRAIPICQLANYDSWANPPADCFASPFYPVMLDSLRVEEVADILGMDAADPDAEFVRRISAGLPVAVKDAAVAMAKNGVSHDIRAVLTADEYPGGPEHVQYPRLAKLRLNKHLSDVKLDDFVTAAPFATAPWLIPVNESEPAPAAQPHLGQILTELRTALWVTARDASGNLADHPTLHPWIAVNLVLALARRHTEPSYEERFGALRDDPHTKQDPLRLAYCRLALDEFTAVVTWFDEEFMKVPHQEWLDRLEFVVQAPDTISLNIDSDSRYGDLVNVDVTRMPVANGRTEIRSNIARLIAARWLTANPFVARDENLTTVIVKSLHALAGVSERADVSALVEAANRYRGGLVFGID